MSNCQIIIRNAKRIANGETQTCRVGHRCVLEQPLSHLTANDFLCFSTAKDFSSIFVAGISYRCSKVLLNRNTMQPFIIVINMLSFEQFYSRWIPSSQTVYRNIETKPIIAKREREMSLVCLRVCGYRCCSWIIHCVFSMYDLYFAPPLRLTLSLIVSIDCCCVGAWGFWLCQRLLLSNRLAIVAYMIISCHLQRWERWIFRWFEIITALFNSRKNAGHRWCLMNADYNRQQYHHHYLLNICYVLFATDHDTYT